MRQMPYCFLSERLLPQLRASLEISSGCREAVRNATAAPMALNCSLGKVEQGVVCTSRPRDCSITTAPPLRKI